MFKTYLDGKFATPNKDLAVGKANFKTANKLSSWNSKVSVKLIRSAKSRDIMSIEEKKRPHPYRNDTATVSAPHAPMPNQHNVRQNNWRSFGLADGGNPHPMTSVTIATTGELSASSYVQNKLSQGHQDIKVNDITQCYTTFILDESNLYGLF